MWSADVLCAVCSVCLFYHHGIPHCAALVWRVEDRVEPREKPLEEGDIASVIEEAVVEDTFREKELAELEKEEGGEK